MKLVYGFTYTYSALIIRGLTGSFARAFVDFLAHCPDIPAHYRGDGRRELLRLISAPAIVCIEYDTRLPTLSGH